MVIGLALAALVDFWILGFKDVEKAGVNSGVLSNALLNTTSTMGVFIAIITALMIGHEYRYNTITYSLTSVNRRIKLFGAKYVVLAVFALVYTAVVALLSWVFFAVGQSLAGVNTVAQQVQVWEVVWRSAVMSLGMMTYAFVISFILRNLIGAIVLILMMPTTIEGLLSLLLKEDTKYLPFTALNSLTNISTTQLTSVLLTISAYVVGGLVIAYWLFQKRDAN